MFKLIVLSLGIVLIQGLVPEPKYSKLSSKYQTINLKDIQLNENSTQCFTVMSAFDRLVDRMRKRSWLRLKPQNEVFVEHQKKEIMHVSVTILKGCNELGKYSMPNSKMDESYSMTISNKMVNIVASELWGVLRSFQTLIQLVKKSKKGALVIKTGTIIDEPRFMHRGFLIDTSRHFLSLAKIKSFVDAMEIVKMNVLHWHIIDDPSFPYKVYTFPDLWKLGSFDPIEAVYSQEDISEVIEYARARGIRVMIEIDTPGHTESWTGLNDIQSPCFNEKGEIFKYGPLNPTLNETYDSLNKLFKEVYGKFPDDFIHLGGDEVNPSCWKSNKDIVAFMKEKNIPTFEALEGFYIKKLIQILDALKEKKTRIFWEEVYYNKDLSDKSSVVHIWIEPKNYPIQAAEITKDGFQVLVSSPWYLNKISYGNDMEQYYDFDPRNFNGSSVQKGLILGGEACIWGEYINDFNLMPVSWPRGSAVAERLWSDESMKDFNKFNDRAGELACFMQNMGLQVGAMEPGYCHN